MSTLKDKLEAIAEDTNLPTGYYKAVLYALSTFDMYDYNVALNQKDLMEYAGIGSKNTLIKTVKELQRLGWLQVTKTKTDCGHFSANVYKVTIPA